MYIMIICHWAILHYNISFQTIIAGWSDGVFWWLSEDQEKNCWIHQNYLVALNVFNHSCILFHWFFPPVLRNKSGTRNNDVSKIGWTFIFKWGELLLQWLEKEAVRARRGNKCYWCDQWRRNILKTNEEFNPLSTRPHQNVVWYNNSWLGF